MALAMNSLKTSELDCESLSSDIEVLSDPGSLTEMSQSRSFNNNSPKKNSKDPVAMLKSCARVTHEPESDNESISNPEMLSTSHIEREIQGIISVHDDLKDELTVNNEKLGNNLSTLIQWQEEYLSNHNILKQKYQLMEERNEFLHFEYKRLLKQMENSLSVEKQEFDSSRSPSCGDFQKLPSTGMYMKGCSNCGINSAKLKSLTEELEKCKLSADSDKKKAKKKFKKMKHKLEKTELENCTLLDKLDLYSKTPDFHDEILPLIKQLKSVMSPAEQLINKLELHLDDIQNLASKFSEQKIDHEFVLNQIIYLSANLQKKFNYFSFMDIISVLTILQTNLEAQNYQSEKQKIMIDMQFSMRDHQLETMMKEKSHYKELVEKKQKQNKKLATKLKDQNGHVIALKQYINLLEGQINKRQDVMRAHSSFNEWESTSLPMETSQLKYRKFETPEPNTVESDDSEDESSVSDDTSDTASLSSVTSSLISGASSVDSSMIILEPTASLLHGSFNQNRDM